MSNDEKPQKASLLLADCRRCHFRDLEDRSLPNYSFLINADHAIDKFEWYPSIDWNSIRLNRWSPLIQLVIASPIGGITATYISVHDFRSVNMPLSYIWMVKRLSKCWINPTRQTATSQWTLSCDTSMYLSQTNWAGRNYTWPNCNSQVTPTLDSTRVPFSTTLLDINFRCQLGRVVSSETLLTQHDLCPK